MKFEINVPDELIKPFVELMNNVTDTLKETSQKVQEEVDKFDSKEFQRRTAHLFEDMKSHVEEIDTDEMRNDIKEAIEELFGCDVRVMSFDDVLMDIVGVSPFKTYRESSKPDETPEPEEDRVNMIDKLLVDINQFDNNAARWLMDEILAGRISEERRDRAHDTTETSATLYFLLRGTNSQWMETPQGAFFWGAIYEKLGGTESC